MYLFDPGLRGRNGDDRRGREEDESAGAPPTSGGRMTVDQARAIVRRAYVEILGREPDWPGAEGYVNALVGGWANEAFVRRELTNSAEYAAKKKAAEASSSATTSPTPASSETFLTSGTVAGIPTWLILGGVALLFLARRK